jgi:hypothetical protein
MERRRINVYLHGRNTDVSISCLNVASADILDLLWWTRADTRDILEQFSRTRPPFLQNSRRIPKHCTIRVPLEFAAVLNEPIN